MILIDTHTHLYEDQFREDCDEMIQRALDAGVSKMIIPNVDTTTIIPMLNLQHKYPNNIFPMIGLHPCYVKPDTYQKELDLIQQYLFPETANIEEIKKLNTTFCAVGEIGIDLYWDKSTLEIQKEAFVTQCKWAVEKNIPVAIHSRDATHILIDILKQLKHRPKGVFHCFTGSREEAVEIIKLGFYLGIGGVVTYKNTNLRETLKNISIDSIVLETDAPYLPPVPFRGKRNESAYVKYVAETLSTVYNMSIDELANSTTQNAERLFGV